MVLQVLASVLNRRGGSGRGFPGADRRCFVVPHRCPWSSRR